MPFWVSLYFAGYIAFGLIVVAREFRLHSEPRWYLLAQVVCEACLLGAGLSYWLAEEPLPPAELRVAIFSLGIAIAIGGGTRELRKGLVLDAELAPRDKWFIGGVVLGIVALVTAPLLYWGFGWAVLGELAG